MLAATIGQRALPRLAPIYNTSRNMSRAHPQKKTQFPIPVAMEKVLNNVKKRQKKRTKRWNRHSERRKKGGKEDDGQPYRPQDETIEIAVNLNVDPRRPGQSLRGSVALPNRTGKKINVAVFTEDEDLTTKAKEMGALHVGGEELIEKMVEGEISVDEFQSSLATADVLPNLSKKLARVLGPRGLMPNPKVGTVAQPGELLELLEDQLAGKEIQYKTEKEGIIHFPIGKSSFGPEKLLENAGAVMTKVHKIKPEKYGKTKKKKGRGKGKAASMGIYVLSASICSTYTKGYKLDLRTVDPSSAYFLSDPAKE